MEDEENISSQTDEYIAPKFMYVLDEFCAATYSPDLDQKSVQFNLQDLLPANIIYFLIDYLVLGDTEGLLIYR